MKKLSLLVIALCITCGSVSAQQALFGGQMPQSPEIHADKTVTFRCMAPSAQKVQITGDFLPTRKIDTPMGNRQEVGRLVCCQAKALLDWYRQHRLPL